MRKTILLIVTIVLFSLKSYSQDSGLGLNGFFVAPEYKALSLNGATQEVQHFFGAKAGVLLSEYFAAGVAFYGSLNEIAFFEDLAFDVTGPDDFMYYAISYEKFKKEVDTKYGGLLIECMSESFNQLHISVPFFIGYGASKVYNVSYDLPNNFTPGHIPLNELRQYEYRSFFIEKDGFFVIEPGVNIEFKAIDMVGVYLGGSYKMIKDNSSDNISKPHLDIQKGFNFNLGVKVTIQ